MTQSTRASKMGSPTGKSYNQQRATPPSTRRERVTSGFKPGRDRRKFFMVKHDCPRDDSCRSQLSTHPTEGEFSHYETPEPHMPKVHPPDLTRSKLSFSANPT